MLEKLNLFIGRLYTLDLKREEGQTMTEYALVLAVLAAGAVAVVGVLMGDEDSGLRGKFADIVNAINASPNDAAPND